MTNQEKYELARQMRAKGATLVRISIDIDVGLNTVKRWFNENYRLRDNYRSKMKRRRRAERLKQNGSS
jgi:hypothetical protein